MKLNYKKLLVLYLTTIILSTLRALLFYADKIDLKYIFPPRLAVSIIITWAFLTFLLHMINKLSKNRLFSERFPRNIELAAIYWLVILCLSMANNLIQTYL